MCVCKISRCFMCCVFEYIIPFVTSVKFTQYMYRGCSISKVLCVGGRYSIKFSSLFPLKSHYFSLQSQTALTHLSHLVTSLKILSRYELSSYICGHSQTAIATSLLLWNQQTPRCVFSGPTAISPLLLCSRLFWVWVCQAN